MPIYMNFTVNGHTSDIGKGQIYGMVCGGTTITPANLSHVGSRIAAQSRGAGPRAGGFGPGAGTYSARPGVRSLVFQRGMDFSSPSLLTHLGKQRVFSSLGLNLVQVNSLGVSVPLATLTLINAVLTGYSLAHGSLGSSSTISWSGSDGDEACKEEVTFEYGGLQIKYLGGIPDVQSGVRIRGRKL